MITLPRKPWLVYPRLGEIEGLIRGGKEDYPAIALFFLLRAKNGRSWTAKRLFTAKRLDEPLYRSLLPSWE